MTQQYLQKWQHEAKFEYLSNYCNLNTQNVHYNKDIMRIKGRWEGRGMWQTREGTACWALVWEQKEPLRRYRFTWKDNIEMDLKCDDLVWRRYISV